MRQPAWAMLWLFLLADPGSASGQVAPWPHEVTHGLFRFHANFPLGRYHELFDELASLPDEVTAKLRIGPPKEMVDVYLFENRQIYDLYMRQYFPNVISRRAMYIKVSGPGNVFAYVADGFDVDLRHECTHAILHACLPMVPLWLDEGLAEYFEVPLAQRADRHPHHADIRRHLSRHGVPPLERLEQLDSLESMGNTEYRDAWAWVHLMLHGPPQARAALLAFMADLNRHVPPDRITTRWAGQQVDAERYFSEHFGPSRRRFLFPSP